MAFDVQAALKRIEGSRGFLLHVLDKTPDDKLDWRPAVAEGGDATTILEIMRHLVASEAHMLAIVKDTPEGPGGSEDWASSAKFAAEGPAATATTKAELVALLNAAGAGFAGIAAAVPADKWDEEYDAGWMKAPRSEFLGMASLHYDYHNGQIAYIQRLYGDLSF
jgi:hypothetical protein